MGDADGSVARDLERRVAGSVALEGSAVAVKGPAIQLYGDFLLWPEGVDLVAENGCVEGGGGQVVLTAEGGKVVDAVDAEHAAAFAALAGKSAQDKPNPTLLDAFAPKFKAAADQTALLELAFDLENAAAATYLYALGVIEATEPAQLVGSILPIEADHAVVLGQVLKKDVADYVPELETASSALKPADYPLA